MTSVVQAVPLRRSPASTEDPQRDGSDAVDSVNSGGLSPRVCDTCAAAFKPAPWRQHQCATCYTDAMRAVSTLGWVGGRGVRVEEARQS